MGDIVYQKTLSSFLQIIEAVPQNIIRAIVDANQRERFFADEIIKKIPKSWVFID